MSQELHPLKVTPDTPIPKRALPLFLISQGLLVISAALVASSMGNNGSIVVMTTIYSVGLIILGLKSPWMLILVTLLLCSLAGVLSAIPLPGGSFSFGTVINGSALVGALISLAFHARRLRWGMIKPYRFFLIFSLWATLGLSIAPVISTALKDVTLFWIPVLIVILTRLISDDFPKNRRWLEQYLLWVNLVPLFILIVGLVFQFVWISPLGIEGLFYARQLTLYLLIPLAIALSWWRNGKSSQERILGKIWTMVLMIVILVGLSRIVIVAAIFLAVLRFFPPKRIVHWVLIISTGILLFLALLQVPQFRARFFFQGQDTTSRIEWSAINTNGRSFFWPLVWNHAMESPIIGHGTGSSRVLVSSVSWLEHPHNDYLRVFHDLGLIGLTIFLLAWGLRMLKDWLLWIRLEKSAPGLAKYRMASFLGAFAVVISFITDNTITFTFVLIPLFTLFAITDAAYIQERKKDAE
jgi:O-antigen ligase